MALSRVVFILTVILLFSINVSASCDDNQININTASAEKLDEIVYIGPARAAEMITLRPFDSVDDMIRIVGIGDIYLSAIKSQDLACVNGQKDEDGEEDENGNGVDAEEPAVSNITNGMVGGDEVAAGGEREIITLNTQVIKTDENTEEGDENYALYGFLAFCFLIGILFVMRSKNKNEFR